MNDATTRVPKALPEEGTDSHLSPIRRPRWVVRVIVYLMLLASAGAALLWHDALWNAARTGALPGWAPFAPAAIFTLFVVVYGVDRYLLVRRRHYPTGRAFFQVALAIIFLTLLWPPHAAELRRAGEQADGAGVTKRLLGSRDADVRAAACELAGLKGDSSQHDRIEKLAREDGSPRVRELCKQALERLHAVVP